MTVSSLAAKNNDRKDTAKYESTAVTKPISTATGRSNKPDIAGNENVEKGKSGDITMKTRLKEQDKPPIAAFVLFLGGLFLPMFTPRNSSGKRCMCNQRI
jgi:hypothetical protein